MVTAAGSQEIAVEAMKSGLDDYIVNTPHNLARLPMTVTDALANATRRSAIEGIEEERNRSLKREQEIRAHLAAIVESSDDAILSKTLDGIITSWNEAAMRLYGYTAEEVIGQTVSMLMPPEQADDFPQIMQRLKRGERIDHYETVRVAKDGKRINISLTVSPIKDASGHLIGASAVARNITEQKRAEAERQELLLREQAARKEAEQAQKLSQELLAREQAALAQAEQALILQRTIEARLMLLTEASATLLSSLRLDTVLSGILELSGRLTACDALAIWRFKQSPSRWEAVSVVGLPEDYQKKWIGVSSDARSFPDTPIVVEDVEKEPLLASRLDMLRQEGVRSLLAVPIRIHGIISGTITFYYKRPEEFSDADIKVVSALANLAASAITTAELYEEQSRLREEAQRAQAHSSFLSEASAILSSSLDYEVTLKNVARLAVPHFADWCVIDLLGADQHINRLVVAHSGPAGESLLHELQERYPYDPNQSSGVANVLRTGQSELYSDITDDLLDSVARNQEHLYMLRQFRLRSAMCVPMLARNRAIGAITFASSKEERQYDSSDLQLAEDLARRAALAVDNARLYRQAQQARTEAEVASRIKDEFLATISHELRTPLNAILGWVGVMRRDGLDNETLVRAIEIIERNARSQSQLIEDLLDVSRIITGKLRLDVRPVELRPIVEAAVDVMRPSADAKGVKLQVVLDSKPGLVSGDPNRLQQVIWNLLSNAVKFTPKGGKVQVRLERINSHVEITVSDTGQGINAKFLPYVFDRFRQADSSYTRRYGGLGLGLAIVRHLVDLHGGAVEVHSPGEGQGATFKVKLPLMITHGISPSQSQALESGQETRADAAEFECPPSRVGLNVLVVEDDPDSREMVKLLLEDCGAKVRAAGSAAEAFAAFQESEPDLLLSDIEMPEEDGYSLIRRVRSLAPDQGGLVTAIALTAHARLEDRLRALAAGFQAHVTKPVSADELLIVIASILGRTGRRSAH
jgi:PAS domain S-box-containing protein